MEWIKVQEQMPPPMTVLILYFEDISEPALGYFHEGHGEWQSATSFPIAKFIDPPSHWMILETPK